MRRTYLAKLIGSHAMTKSLEQFLQSVFHDPSVGNQSMNVRNWHIAAIYRLIGIDSNGTRSVIDRTKKRYF